MADKDDDDEKCAQINTNWSRLVRPLGSQASGQLAWRSPGRPGSLAASRKVDEITKLLVAVVVVVAARDQPQVI